jgi:membrane protein DedA with SNARE-associated domain
MSIIPHGEVSDWVHAYGYWAVGGLVALESMGLPVPGETVLVGTAILAGSTTNLGIVGIVAAAALGAVLGDNVGFWIGREVGFPLLRRYGPWIRITERKIKLGQYLFLRHGGKVVFFGRFVAILRALAAFLAGVNCIPWLRFLVVNATGGVVWASVFGFGGWYLGEKISEFAAPSAIILGLVAVVVLALGYLYLRHHTAELEARAEAAFPGPLRPHPARHPDDRS